MNSAYSEHDITLASFAQIDEEIGTHHFRHDEYAVIRRVIHATADFEFRQLLRFSHRPFEAALSAFAQRQPIITDVSMVAAGIRTVVNRTWRSPISIAVQQANSAPASPLQGGSQSDSQSGSQAKNTHPPNSTGANQTRSALGMRQSACEHPGAIVAVGNAPTALLTLCEGIQTGLYAPALVIGAPVGFINVTESKQALADLDIPHIVVTGRKGGSAVAAAILNALMINAWNEVARKS